MGRSVSLSLFQVSHAPFGALFLFLFIYLFLNFQMALFSGYLPAVIPNWQTYLLIPFYFQMADGFEAKHQLPLLWADHPSAPGDRNTRVPALGGLGYCQSNQGQLKIQQGTKGKAIEFKNKDCIWLRLFQGVNDLDVMMSRYIILKSDLLFVR